MKKTWFALALLGAALAGVTGCASDHDKGPYLPANVPGKDVENNARFVLLDPRAQYSVDCANIQETRLSDGRLQVAANLRNRENRRIQVQANCDFKDAQGFVVESTPFQNVFLDENSQQGVQFASSNDKAIRYTIRVRQAR